MLEDDVNIEMYFIGRSFIEEIFFFFIRLGIVYRLDKGTSGLLVVVKVRFVFRFFLGIVFLLCLEI